jgi:hypothetical protein
MYSISLESHNPYLHSQKVSKNLKIECIHSSLPRNAKSRFGSLSPLGINPKSMDLGFVKIDV